MESEFINLTTENVVKEHLCCAISDKKHQYGVEKKRAWLSERIKEGHVFRKLNQNGKVFIEYSPLEYCIEDAKAQGKAGVCILSSNKKKPFLSEKKFMRKFGFVTADTVGGEYELLALSLDGTMPSFTDSVRRQGIDDMNLTIYYGLQCPYIPNCIEQIENYCRANQVPLSLVKVDSLEKSKSVPAIFNNWAVFYRGEFKTLHLLNEGFLKQLLEEDTV